ncbi:hypothetical protein HG535_0C02570 [Zygotorulaspora mrakii]|uniref:Importin N-terminal domain-containing protein n=1 Tax=Zygotorulaspora mrakii TaxID=42260 RepID=A0A7H9AZN1_ZYGMR|nr:uncharacterized protein HG535_0C02570 [Zygotorulaspora mrakii]QLG71905.1 hypothetical protein HG535_0C02570 [Zygotorulaspora mrakii]
MSSWQPNGEYLLHVATLLKNSMSPNQEERSQAMEALKTFQLQSEFLNYLCYILIEGETNELLKSHLSLLDLQNNRATAGLLLKNTMLEEGSLTKGTHDIQYVKSNIIHGLYNSSNALVSNVTGIVITTLFSTYYRQHREDPQGIEMLSQLLELASNGNESSIKALSKIMEDSAQFFQLKWSGDIKPMDMLVSVFIRLTGDPASSPVIKSEAIKCLNNIVPLQSQSFIVKIDDFLNIIFNLAQSDENDLVRAQICVSFATILEFRPDKLIDHLSGIIHFMLHLIGSVLEEKVAIEACEFLHAFATNSQIPQHIVQPYVKDVVPVLLAKMVYNEETILALEVSNEDDAFEEDKDEDIRPVAPRIVKKRDGDADSEDEDADDSEVDTQWNLRKCSASTLDVLTNLLPGDVVNVAIPFLREHLTSERWYIREATVLALGAMAEGGVKYFDDQLPALVPFLVQQLKDSWAPVRKITCWTLSRFSPWILMDHTEFLIPVLEPIVNTLMDRKKDVQEAAISAVAVFIENCDSELIETLLYKELLSSFSKCFELYKKKNLIILYDAVGRLAEKCELDDMAMQTILPHLIAKWSSLSDNDKELWPLLECLSYVATSLGERFMPMAPEVYNRAYMILRQCVELDERSHQDPNIVVPEKDFVITSLDLIDGLVQGLGPQSEQLLFPQGNKNTLILNILIKCLHDPVHEVRQSAFALLGDIVYFHEPRLLANSLPEFLKLIAIEMVHNDDSDGVSALVNAIWCLGLIGERINLTDYIVDLSRLILDLFTTTSQILDKSVTENLAITIGRLGMTLPEVFSSGPFASDSVWSKWCLSVNDLESLEEKSSAYMGFIKIVNLTGYNVSITDETLKSILEGLAVNVDVTIFAQDIYALLMKYSDKIQILRLSQEAIALLQQFSSN